MRLINRNKAAKTGPSKSELFESFISGASGGCIIFDSTLTSLQMNSSAMKMLNLSTIHASGSNIKEILPNMDQESRLDLLHGVVKSGKSVQFKDYLITPENKSSLFEVAAFKVDKGLGLIICDTSEYKSNAVSLTGDNQAIEAIQDLIHEPFLILDSRNRVLNANKAFHTLFGYKSAEIVNISIFEIAEAQWNIPDIHELLEHKLSQTGAIKDFEVTAYFGKLGLRTLRLNASKYYLELENHLLTFLAIRDITELASQREKLQKLSTIFSDAPDPILITDLEGKIVDINGEGIRLYGWPRVDLIGKSFKTLIPTTSRDQYDNLLQTVIAASRISDVEVEHWSKNGAILPISMHVHLLKDREAANIGTVTYVKHIASQSQAEKALKRLYDMVLYSNDPVIIVDLNGSVVDINDAAETAYSWPKASISGKPGTTMVPEEDVTIYQSNISACLTGKKVQEVAMRRITKQGVIRNAKVSMHLLTDAKNKSTGVAITVKHITDTDRARRVQRRMIEEFMQIDDPVIIENLVGEVIDLNQAAASAYGWAKSDLVGKLAKSVIPVDQQKQASELIAKCKSGETIRNFPGKRWSKAGKFFPVKLTMFQMTDAEEVPESIVTISRLVNSTGGAVASNSPIDMDQLFREHVDPIVVEDLSGTVIEMNFAASKMLGWKPQDLKGKPIKMIIPADQHKQHEKILLLCQNNVPIHKVESKRWSKTGEVYPVAVSLVQLKDSEGNPTAIASITWDISDVKKLERDGRNLKKQLGQH